MSDTRHLTLRRFMTERLRTHGPEEAMKSKFLRLFWENFSAGDRARVLTHLARQAAYLELAHPTGPEAGQFAVELQRSAREAPTGSRVVSDGLPANPMVQLEAGMLLLDAILTASESRPTTPALRGEGGGDVTARCEGCGTAHGVEIVRCMSTTGPDRDVPVCADCRRRPANLPPVVDEIIRRARKRGGAPS
ncbi:hypothetical protein ACQEU8_26730 [Streptomyces sp. CA-250714]|uniref:hypothetical protein n=1 Tax=Streptomyces sp. CA-250714 TaxID=3240060 RepID=UPI003D9392EF